MAGPSAETPRLHIAIGDSPVAAALISGRVASDRLRLDFAAIKPISRAFAPMVREGRFDVSEMAIATFLQARAYGKPLVLLPVVLAARFQEAALLCRAESDIAEPADLAGRRIGVRAYSQTTGMWLRGILAEQHGVRPDAMRWTTFEDAHVAEYRDPLWAERAAPGRDMMTMLREGALDAAIVGNDLPDDPRLRTVFPDPAAAGRAFVSRHGFMPVNHLLTVRREIAETRPDLVAEVLRLVRESAALAPSGSVPPAPATPETLRPALALALRYCEAQGLLPRPFSVEDAWDGLPAG